MKRGDQVWVRRGVWPGPQWIRGEVRHVATWSDPRMIETPTGSILVDGSGSRLTILLEDGAYLTNVWSKDGEVRLVDAMTLLGELV